VARTMASKIKRMRRNVYTAEGAEGHKRGKP
jgi:hypothetical protein